MIALIISLIITLAILGICYIVLKWIFSVTGLPAPLVQVASIIFGLIALIIVLKALLPLIHA